MRMWKTSSPESGTGIAVAARSQTRLIFFFSIEEMVRVQLLYDGSCWWRGGVVDSGQLTGLDNMLLLEEGAGLNG